MKIRILLLTIFFFALTGMVFAGGAPPSAPQVSLEASDLIDGGSDPIDGDKIEISRTWDNITPDHTGDESDSDDDLAAILEGIDDALGTIPDLASPGAIGSTTPAAGAFVGITTSNGATGPGYIYFKEDSDNGTNTVQLIGPASTADVVQTLQAVTGTVLCTGSAVGRDYSTTNHTSTGNITEAHILASKWHTNNGASAEIDLTLPALSYTVGIVFIVQETQIIEINPPSGELFDHDGVDLDADDCVDTSAVVGDKIAFTRILLADGSTWRWSTDTIRGNHIDTGATD